MKCVLLLIVLSCAILQGDGYKILGVFPTMAKSHHIVGSAVMKGLAERGHDVTVVSPFPLKTPMKNYRDITVSNILEATKDIMNNLWEEKKGGTMQTLANNFNMGLFFTNTTFQDPAFKKFLNSNEKFDVIVLEIFLNEAMIGLAHKFNAPIVGLSTFGASPWTCDLVGSPAPPSYIPNIFLKLTDRMTLLQRMENLAVFTFEKIYNEFIYLPKQEILYEKNFANPKPTMHQLRKNVSLVLLNNHFSVSYPRPYVPNMIEVGGLHINMKPKPLPADIKKYLDDAKDGAIYFSMGSNLKSKQLPKEKLDHFLKAFKSLKQKVLWKFEEKNLPGKSDNIFISDWFPQDDILAHPNVKLFITHGGLLSTMESIYHGVPVIGIPIFGDQHLNMARVESSGFGLTVKYSELTSDILTSGIKNVLENEKYSAKMKEVSKRFRDQPMSAMDTAAYWIEYVARHQGAPHLHSAGQELSFIQYHNLDALAIFIGALVLVVYLFVFTIKAMCGLVKPTKQQLKKRKTN